MLGFAIRIVDAQSDFFFKDIPNLLNQFIVGVPLEECKFFFDDVEAQHRINNLNKLLQTRHTDGTYLEYIRRNNSSFVGFEMAEIEFDEVYFKLKINICEETEVFVRDIDYDGETGHPFVTITNDLGKDTMIFTSYNLAKRQIEILTNMNFKLAEKMEVITEFTNPRIME